MRGHGWRRRALLGLIGGFGALVAAGWWLLRRDGMQVGPFSRVRLSEPEQCRSALLETESCEGEDTSFQECRYQFRAVGKPKPDVCRKFLAREGRSAGEMPSFAGACPETSPMSWRPVDCADFGIGPGFTCFRCDDPELERARHLLVAYDAGCQRGVVLKSCNQPLPKKVAEP